MIIDGVLEEGAWEMAEKASGFVQTKPDEGQPASEPTEVWVLLDRGKALYVGARLTDSDAGEIVSQLARRDVNVFADWFFVYLDSHHDRRTAFGFGVSAAGEQRDLRYFDDWMSDVQWDAVWASAVTIDGGGWTVEMRIPLSQLRFNAAEQGDSWGMNFERRIARKAETSFWAGIPQDALAFVSLFGELKGVDELEPSRGIEILPYAVGRIEAEKVDPADPFRSSRDASGSMGVDARIGVGSSLILSATVNPDFGQVEADPSRVNLTAFELYEQERRPFFVEGADLFRLEGAGANLFHSRRIGRRPHGSAPGGAAFVDVPKATRILGAAKLSGRTAGGWSLGVLGAVTPEEEARYATGEGSLGTVAVEPLTSYFAGRLSKAFGGGRTSLGILATALNRMDGSDRFLYLHDAAFSLALDGRHRFAEDAFEVSFSLGGSRVQGDTLALQQTQRAPGHYFQRPGADHLAYDPGRTSLSGFSGTVDLMRLRGSWTWGLSAKATSPGFEINDLGFNPALDRISGNGFLRYQRTRPGTRLRRWGIGGSLSWGGDFSGLRQSFVQNVVADVTLLNYSRARGVLFRDNPAWTTTALRGGPALRQPGRWRGSVGMSSDGRKRLIGAYSASGSVEDGFRGWSLSHALSLSFRPSSRVDLTLAPSLDRARQSWQYVGRKKVEDEEVFLFGALDQRTVSLTTRLNLTFSPALSFQLYARPYLATGDFDALREVADPGALDFDQRFRTFSEGQLLRDSADLHSIRVDRDGDGRAEFTLTDPSFDQASFQMNLVLRWEYRPGSTLFAVWTQDRGAFSREALTFTEDLDRLWNTPSRNVFLLKVSYWLSS